MGLAGLVECIFVQQRSMHALHYSSLLPARACSLLAPTGWLGSIADAGDATGVLRGHIRTEGTAAALCHSPSRAASGMLCAAQTCHMGCIVGV